MSDSERVIVIVPMIAAFFYFIGFLFILKPTKPRNLLLKQMDFMYGSGGEKQKVMLREGWFLGYLRFCGVIMVLLASILVFFGIYHFL
jgi:hypothetical protein